MKSDIPEASHDVNSACGADNPAPPVNLCWMVPFHCPLSGGVPLDPERTYLTVQPMGIVHIKQAMRWSHPESKQREGPSAGYSGIIT